MNKSGFTLLELSIVLVIIGLIIGGITVGQEMIKSAELNSIINDVQKYSTAVNTFKLKYNALPGDMDNAQSYWPTCVDVANSPCNGNGNGNFWDGRSSAAGSGYYEGLRAWQHLSLSEIISGNFDGLYTAEAFGKTYPESSITGMGYQFLHIGASSTCGGNTNHALYGVTQKSVMQIGAIDAANSNCLSQGTLPVVDASSIDTKMDDGKADRGKVLGVNADGDATGCAGQWDNSVTSASYDLSSTDANCRLVFF